MIQEQFDKRNYRTELKRQNANLFVTVNGQMVKIFNNEFLLNDKPLCVHTEEKIKQSEKIEVTALVKPKSIIYKDNNFVGYRMPFIPGPSLTNYTKTVKQSKRLKFAKELIISLEKTILDLEKYNIVMPNLIEPGNIIINKNEGLKLIDYDDIQINHNLSNSFPSELGSSKNYINTKYTHFGRMAFEPQHFTSELNRLSLLVLYFKTAFNIDLISQKGINKNLLLVQIIHKLGLEDDLIAQKVYRIYNNDATIGLISEDAKRIEKEYQFNNNQNSEKILIRR